jgi:ActD protein
VKHYGIIAEFDSPAAILRAAEKVRDAGYRRWDTFTPFPIHGMEKVMKLGNSLVGWVSLAMGAGAFLSVVGLIWFANAFDYPLIVGGKPMFSEPMTFVPAYILLIMGSAIGALVGMLALNQLPRLHHPLFANKNFALATRDKFFLAIGATDPKFSETETRKLLEEIGGANIELVEDED